MQGLFAVGNPDPLISSYTDFQNLVQSKEFRIAVALRNIQAEWDDMQNKIDISFDPPDIVMGYTPLNLWFPGSGGNWSYQNCGYSSGVGSGNVQTQTNVNSCTISIYARFKISWLLNVLQSAFTFHMAPSAIVQLEYTLYRDGSINIIYFGSLLPSQRYYIDWQLEQDHDMKIISSQDIGSFVTAGNCKDAPVHQLYTWTQ
jgi:hypothetical protein